MSVTGQRFFNAVSCIGNGVSNPTFRNGFQPKYDGPVKFVRHSSQGDVKYHPDIVKVVEKTLKTLPDSEFHFMPAPSFLPDMKGVFKYGENQLPVPEFLAKGNIYWYMLPDGYLDNGPRVIMEAMTMGLPVLADKRGGAADRLKNVFVHDWLDMPDIVHQMDLKSFGETNKQISEIFDPENWIKALEE